MDVPRDILDSDIREILAVPGIREVIAVPRISPREVREELAAILAEDLVIGTAREIKDPDQAARRLGPLFLMLNAMRGTVTWAKLKALSSRNRMIALLCLSSTLEALLETQEEVYRGRLPPGKIEAVLAFQELLAETFSLWGRRPGLPPGSGSAGIDYYGSDDNIGFIHEIVRQSLIPRLAASLEEISESVDAIELTSLLSTGRGWDHAMVDLHQEDVRDIKRYSDLVRRNRGLAALIDDLGRASAGCATTGDRLLSNDRSELHSIVTSDDLSYLLPSELVKLQDRVLKYLFFTRWAEGKLLTYQLKDRENLATDSENRKGPVVALIDTSGSMDGAPGILAKAIVLAAARHFLRQGRVMKVVLFSSIGQVSEIDLSGGQIDPFMDFLRSTFGGGTDFDTALHSGLRALNDDSYRFADLLFVTDGLSRLTDENLLADWRQLKEARGSRIYTIIVGNDHAGGLEDISDRVYIFGAGDVKKAIQL